MVRIEADESAGRGMLIGADGSAKQVRMGGGGIKSGPLFEAFHGITGGLFRRSGRELTAAAGDLGLAYSSEVWAYRCIKLRSDALASVPLILLDRDGQRITEHPILDLLRDVNPHTMNLGDLLRSTEAAYNIWGAAYWRKGMAGSNGNGRGNRVKALEWLNPQTVEPITDARRGIIGYKQIIGGETRVYAPEEIIAFRNFDPMDDLGGLSPLSVTINQVNAELNAARFVSSFFANDARPSGLLTTDQPMMEQDIERTSSWWKKLFQGVGNKWKTGIVGSGLKWQSISPPPTELALAELRAEDRRAICAAFGVPAALAGAWEATTYATAREQKASFYEDTMIPQMEYIVEVLNWSLLRPHFPDLAARGARLAFDIDSITALGESATAKAERLMKLYQAGVMTREEVRAGLGLPALDSPMTTADSAVPDEPDSERGGAADQGAGAEFVTGAQVPRRQMPLRSRQNAPLHTNGHGRKALQAAPHIAPDPAKVLQAELDRWERFVLRRMKARRPIRAFRSPAIPPEMWWRIATALSSVTNLDEVRRVFDEAVSSQQPAISERQSAAGAD